VIEMLEDLTMPSRGVGTLQNARRTRSEEPEEVLTLHELADRYKINYDTLTRWIAKGKLTAEHGLFYLGRSARVRVSMFEANFIKGARKRMSPGSDLC
jgi:hypothetical protein